MKNILRTAAIAALLAVAYLSNTHAVANTAALSMSSASPVPNCPPNDPNGCGIGNF